MEIQKCGDNTKVISNRDKFRGSITRKCTYIYIYKIGERCKNLISLDKSDLLICV